MINKIVQWHKTTILPTVPSKAKMTNECTQANSRKWKKKIKDKMF